MHVLRRQINGSSADPALARSLIIHHRHVRSKLAPTGSTALQIKPHVSRGIWSTTTPHLGLGAVALVSAPLSASFFTAFGAGGLTTGAPLILVFLGGVRSSGRRTAAAATTSAAGGSRVTVTRHLAMGRGLIGLEKKKRGRGPDFPPFDSTRGREEQIDTRKRTVQQVRHHYVQLVRHHPVTSTGGEATKLPPPKTRTRIGPIPVDSALAESK
jgi:hypothetical protein